MRVSPAVALGFPLPFPLLLPALLLMDSYIAVHLELQAKLDICAWFLKGIYVDAVHVDVSNNMHKVVA